MNPLAAIARNKRKTLVFSAYVVVTVAIVVWRARQYAEAPTVLVAIARGSAAGIYLNAALVLLPMMRLLLSRRFVGPLRVVLPFHKAQEAHAVAGVAMLGFSVVHCAAYAGLFAWHLDVVRPIATPAVVVSGAVLTLGLAALAWGAWVRRSGRYEVFYTTHFLTIPIGLALWVHAPWFLPIVGPPLAVFLLDRLLRVVWMARPAEVVAVAVDGRDLDLVLRRPEGFGWAPGDYAFLCVPGISRLQWHPFSLVNAPDDEGEVLSFRIRRAGGWTAALSRLAPGARVYVDGPFASPSRDLQTSRRAIVVAGGIGITPFVSFLEGVRRSGAPPFERLHLVWIERDEASFSRFAPLIRELVEVLGPRLTAELVAGETETRPGPLVVQRRIVWDEELRRLTADGLGDATVFFCGTAALSEQVRTASRPLGLRFRTESF